MDIFFWGKKPPQAIKWEEVRGKILKAIEEERRIKAPINITSSSIATDPLIIEEHEQTITTSDTADKASVEFSKQSLPVA